MIGALVFQPSHDYMISSIEHARQHASEYTIQWNIGQSLQKHEGSWELLNAISEENKSSDVYAIASKLQLRSRSRQCVIFSARRLILISLV